MTRLVTINLRYAGTRTYESSGIWDPDKRETLCEFHQRDVVRFRDENETVTTGRVIELLPQTSMFLYAYIDMVIESLDPKGGHYLRSGSSVELISSSPERYPLPKTWPHLTHRCQLHGVYQSQDRGGGCRPCKAAARENTAVRYPHLVSEWHPDNPLKLQEVNSGSTERYKWVCPEGHTYTASVLQKAYQRYTCPRCPTWAAEAPHLISELAENVEVGGLGVNAYHTPLEWRCGDGHSFKQTRFKRERKGLHCPKCVERLFDPFRAYVCEIL